MLGVHIALRANDDLSPWKGAGFAMFSTVDSPGMRSVAVWADVAGVEERTAERQERATSCRPADVGRDDGLAPPPARTPRRMDDPRAGVYYPTPSRPLTAV